ncbi:MAG: calcium-binding protein [Planctomycetes bacterium]|nr:calcium-binding protein [Planctomycetota bacterium]
MATNLRNRVQPVVERLEDRLVPAVSAVFAAGRLIVTGTAASETIEVRQKAGRISVVGATINDAGVPRASLAAAKVDVIRIDGGRGNDVLQFETVAVANPASNALNRPIHTRMFGGRGDDTLKGGEGADLLVGGMGSDTLWGRGGSDTLFGDSQYSGVQTKPFTPGANTTVFNFKESVYYPMTALTTNVDSLNFALAQEATPGACGNDKLYGGDGNDILFGGFGNDWLWGGAGNDDLYGMHGVDMLMGDSGNFTIAGNDRLFGGAGSDFLFGEQGHDYLAGGDDADWLYGGAGDDFLYGEMGNDRLYGDDGVDRMSGGDGDDQLFGGFGIDLLFGDAGNDLLDGGNQYDRSSNQLIGGAGDDTMINYIWTVDDSIFEEPIWSRDTIRFRGDGADTVIERLTATWL